MKTKRILILGAVLLTLLACKISIGEEGLPTVTPVPPTAAPPTATPRPEETPPPTPSPDDEQIRQNLLRSTVQILALIESGGQLQPAWTGSGTILTRDGIILTNAHVVRGPDPVLLPAKALGIALTIRSDQPPELTYLAEPVVVNDALDLAVLRVATDLDGRPVDTEQLNLPHVPVGDSDLLELGDRLRVLGYPGIGGETITFTEGTVSGFTRDRSVEGRAWIKTDATIAGGNSGGLGANIGGEIVGVPTRVGYGAATPDDFTDCRFLADTNGDGRIDQNDTCIPVGGFINALRPVNLAEPLIEAAKAGIELPTPQLPTPVPGAEPHFYNLRFSPGVTENDQPTQIVTELPSGATGCYLFWDYEGMVDGIRFEARWYLDGEFIESASLPPSPWSGGESGNWWVGIINEDGLSEGVWSAELYVQDELLAQASIPIGGMGGGPAFTNLIFSPGVTADDRPTQPGYLLPSGTTEAYAFFDYENMTNGTLWSRTWYYERQVIAEWSGTWEFGPSGTAWVGLTAEEPLDPGTYRLELFIQGNLAAASDFTVAGTQTEEVFGLITFAEGQDARGNPINPGTAFDTGLLELHFFTPYNGMRDGMDFSERWLFGGEELVIFDTVWDQGASGTFHDYIYRTSGEPLPDGEWTLELLVEGQLVQSGSATIGVAGPRPTPPPPPEGLFIQGYILDADTGQGIPGVGFIVLKPGVTVESWDGSEEQVYTWAETDINGYFELPLPLERNQRYSMIVAAQGYIPILEDDVLVSDEPSPLELEIVLQRE